MNKVDRLYDLFGSGTKISMICGVSRSLVSRWKRRGAIPPMYNLRLKTAARDEAYLNFDNDHDREVFISSVSDCLELAECPTCGQKIDEHKVL